MVAKGSSHKNGATGGGWNVMAEQSKKVQLLDKYLCDQCHKWKSTQQYSKNQLSTYQWKAATGPNKVDGVTAQLKCRVCVGEQVTELMCQGTCDMYRSLSDFSKSQRTHPETAWCYTCIQWREACEPEVSVQAPPNAILSNEEEREVAGFSIGAADLEGGYSDSDDEFDDDDNTYSSMAALSVNEMHARAGSTASTVGRGSANKSASAYTASSMSNPYASLSEYSGGAGESHQLKASHAGLSANQASESGWSVVDARRNPQKAGLAYNAYDLAGNLHNRVREPSTSGSASDVPSTTPGPRAAQNYTVGPSGWAKTASRKTPMPSFPAISRPQRRRNNYDDDESEDEM